MSSALLIGGAALFLLASGKKKSTSKRRRVACPPLQPGSGQIAGYDYIEFTTGGANLHESLPIVVFFHSMGAGPKSLVKHIEGIPTRARIVMPCGHYKKKWWEGRASQSDQEELAAQMTVESQKMVRFVEEANVCLRGVGAPVITGHSQGGMMTFAVAAAAPGLVKAAVPVSGWLPTSMWPRSMPPTSAVHGTDDRTVDFARTADFVERAAASGLPIEFYPIEGRAHGLGGGLKSTWLDLLTSAVDS